MCVPIHSFLHFPLCWGFFFMSSAERSSSLISHSTLVLACHQTSITLETVITILTSICSKHGRTYQVEQDGSLALLHLSPEMVQKTNHHDGPLQKIHTLPKTRLYNFDPLKPHFYIVKLGFTGVYIIFLISAQKHRVWVLVRFASARRY